ncbi:MAG: DoxX family protein [Phycisphaeraceae bacterium]
MNATRQQLMTSVGLLILRLGIGGYMLTHGWGKLKLLLAGEFDALGDPVGLGAPATLVLLVLAEFVCALLVVVGLATRLAAVPLVIAMAVAAFLAHGSDPWTTEQAVGLFMAGETDFPLSKQPALMFLIPFLALIFTGPGGFSIDALLRRRGARSGVTNGQQPN